MSPALGLTRRRYLNALCGYGVSLLPLVVARHVEAQPAPAVVQEPATEASPSPNAGADSPPASAPPADAAPPTQAEPPPAAPPSNPEPTRPSKPAPASDAMVDAAADAALAGADSLITAEASMENSRVHVYGFTDFAFAVPLNDAAKQLVMPSSTFLVGHFNVYMGAEFGSGWRSLSEVRFMYLPNGVDWTSRFKVGGAPTEVLRPGGSRTDTTVTDPSQAAIQAPIRWGAIDIQRAWLEYTQNEYLTIRAGQFLTPYGIWNVDHGSPVLIGVHMPLVSAAVLFPERQTGLELYGSAYLGQLELGYHLTVSNGRGPIDTYRDLDANKAIGGRLFASTDALLGTLTIGTSAYRGKYTDLVPETVAATVRIQYDEFSLAGDVKWQWHGLLAQGEALMNDVAYLQGRPRYVLSHDDQSPKYQPDFRSWGAYGLVGYRIPWLNVMPYVAAERYSGIYKYRSYWGGLNVRPIAPVVVKAQYSYLKADDGANLGDEVHLFETQAAWSF